MSSRSTAFCLLLRPWASNSTCVCGGGGRWEEGQIWQHI
jgi:hypothetical protein